MIAVLGATGTVGSSLARRLAQDAVPPTLFARDPKRLAETTWPQHVEVRALDEFSGDPFELIINCIGVGDPARVAALGSGVFDLTKTWDDRVIGGMRPGARYVFMSSGIVHETKPVPPAYATAKRAAEARHREARDRAILDIRIFGYADPAMPIDGTFFLSDLARCIVRGEPFVTTPLDMVRDYAGAEEVAQLIACWTAGGAPNIALDLYTKTALSKSELLEVARNRYGMRIETRKRVVSSPTGHKPVYAAQNRAAAAFGYTPRRTAMEVVIDTLDTIVAAARPLSRQQPLTTPSVIRAPGS
jgi:nucleoside-diphosphate-sugar epimerase